MHLLAISGAMASFPTLLANRHMPPTNRLHFHSVWFGSIAVSAAQAADCTRIDSYQTAHSPSSFLVDESTKQPTFDQYSFLLLGNHDRQS